MQTTRADVLALLETVGPVVDCHLATTQSGGPHRGYGFALFTCDENARAAVGSLNGKELGGKRLVVDLGRRATDTHLGTQLFVAK